MPDIVLTTLNARYIHASLGLRYLMANMADLQPCTQIMEFTINQQVSDIVEQLLAVQPKIIGLGVYIWNVEQTTQVVAQIKLLRPGITIILGGPEVSYEPEQQPIVSLADYTIRGAADLAFSQCCSQVLKGNTPADKLIQAQPVKLEQLQFPYQFYNDDDVAHRVVYVEASRGCPFKCEFCLSSLDKTAWPFALDKFLEEMESLYQRGVRHFKFVDRTFNLKIASSIRIMEFFLEKMPADNNDLFLHFELIPDHLPDKLKNILKRFPAGSLQFEIGIQTFDPVIQQHISRQQDNDKSKQNIRWLREHTSAHLHTDLILGLPGDTLATIEHSFNELYALNPHEIQVGILKRLRGTPIIRHTDSFDMKYNPYPPYNILQTSTLDYDVVQKLVRFSRYWDIIANSGHFKNTLPLLVRDNPFNSFMRFSTWLYQQTQQTHRFALRRLFELIHRYLLDVSGLKETGFISQLQEDYAVSGQKGILPCLSQVNERTDKKHARASSRQARHH